MFFQTPSSFSLTLKDFHVLLFGLLPIGTPVIRRSIFCAGCSGGFQVSTVRKPVAGILLFWIHFFVKIPRNNIPGSK